MSKNIQLARRAIEAELKHAEEGAAYYRARAESLRLALQQLDGTNPSDANKAAKKPAKSVRKTASSRSQQRKPKSPKASDLPSTPAAYWLQFIGAEPRSAIEIANAAIASLGFAPSAEQEKKLKQRAAPALHALLAGKQIKDTGSGRQRRFYLAGSTPEEAPGKRNMNSKHAVVDAVNGSA